MKAFRLWALALALTCWMAGPARAAAWDDMAKAYLGQLATKSVNGNVPRGLNPDSHFITINPPDWYDIEQAAVSGFSWGVKPERNVVGGAFRGYSEGSWAAWGIATEALSAPTSNAHLIGAELLVASRNGNSNDSVKWGLNIILTNRSTGVTGALESPIGKNGFNEHSRAVVIESFPRSSAGEYSGWQAGMYFGPSALDRTASKPYATVIDVSDVGRGAEATAQGNIEWYVIVFRCGQSRCGLKTTILGLELWEMIDTTPKLVRIL